MRKGDRVPLIISGLSAILLLVVASFLAGFYFRVYQPWPHEHFSRSLRAISTFVKTGRLVPHGVMISRPANQPASDWAVNPGATLPSGFRIVSGWFRELDGYGVRIYDPSGSVAHRISFKAVEPGTHSTAQGDPPPHAVHMMPDGSVIAVFDRSNVMARLNACGVPMWQQKGAFHHSLDQADDGSIWTWRGHASTGSQYQYLVRFDPATGRELQRIRLVEDVIMANPEARLAFGIMPGVTLTKESGDSKPLDRFHPNDLDVLSAREAGAFPGFAAGDLLLSFRNNDLIAVLDPQTKRLKWWRQGPWAQQHDPDFMPDGRLSIFDNGRQGQLSAIVIVDPRTDALDALPIRKAEKFYTEKMGKHQWLPDGGVLLAVEGEGRALEYDASGRRRLIIANRFDDERNAYVSDALWVPRNFFRQPPSLLKCPGGRS